MANYIQEGREMRYFKHYCNTDSSTFIQKVIKEHGLIGYAWWNLLLELMCSKYNGSSILIQLTVPEVAQKLRIKSSRVHSIITSFSELSDNQVITKLESNDNQANFDGFIIIISAPIMSDLQDRDFKFARTKRVASDAKIIDKRYKIKDNTKSSFLYDAETLYQKYPRKSGKSEGLKRFEKIITSQEIYDQVELAIQNYAKSVEGAELKFIKHFSTFASCWKDYLEIQLSERDEAINTLLEAEEKAKAEYLASINEVASA